MRTSVGYSSYGTLVFDADTGDVFPEQVSLDPDFGEIPARVNVAEWQRRYPGEDICLGNDILDYGYWMADGTYVPPAEEWRKENEPIWEETRKRLLESEG